MRQSTSIIGCVRRLVNWSVGLSDGWCVGNAFVRRSTRRTLLAYLAFFLITFLDTLLIIIVRNLWHTQRRSHDLVFVSYGHNTNMITLVSVRNHVHLTRNWSILDKNQIRFQPFFSALKNKNTFVRDTKKLNFINRLQGVPHVLRYSKTANLFF